MTELFESLYERIARIHDIVCSGNVFHIICIYEFMYNVHVSPYSPTWNYSAVFIGL